MTFKLKARPLWEWGRDVENSPEPEWLIQDLILRDAAVQISGPATLGHKQQPITEPVLTPSGWKPIGTLKVGDEVINSRGGNSEVTGVYPQTNRKVFRLTFSDGSHTLAGPEHLWSVQDKSMRSRGSGWKTLTTAEVQASLKRGWYVPLVRPVQLTSKRLPVDPYFLGVALGDGCFYKSGGCAITTQRAILDLVPEASSYRPSAKCTTAEFPQRHFAGLSELAGSRSWDKRVPHRYLWAQANQRLLLLQGLMDTDGSHASAKRSTTFTTVSKGLAQDVQHLVWSLGGTAKIADYASWFTYKGERRDGPRRVPC